jgi:CRISPR-associated endonuclease/helicase Cas3
LGLRLVWLVGNRTHYDAQGRFAVASQIRKKDVPMHLRHAALVAALAGYSHDLGKASRRFQNKLHGSATNPKDYIRHEWLSAYLLNLLLVQMQGTSSAIGPEALAQAWQTLSRQRTGDLAKPLPVPLSLENASHCVLWAVCTHHGAIGGEIDKKDNILDTEHIRKHDPTAACAEEQDHKTLHVPAFECPQSPQDAQRWRDLFEKISKTIHRLAPIQHPSAYWEGVMLTARACLILADHQVSSERFAGAKEDASILYANTKPMSEENQPPRLRRGLGKAKKMPPSTRALDQPLSWHLSEVGQRTSHYIRMLAGHELPRVNARLVHTLLGQRAPRGSRFEWQDQAVDHVQALNGGRLVFNVASTGAGKTLGNLKMAFAMREPHDVRLAVAFNLRSLTTQTYEAFARHLKTIDAHAFKKDFACLLGQKRAASDVSSAPHEDDDDVPIDDLLDFLGDRRDDLPSWLSQLSPKGVSETLVKLVASPVLISTMDWIVAAGEPGQQARHAQALIRLASSDLMIDEVDSYDLKATVAVMRVVQVAASFGRHVIVSSATLNPQLAHGIGAAYAAGYRVFQAHTQAPRWHLVFVDDTQAPLSLCQPSLDEAHAAYRNRMKHVAAHLLNTPVTKRYRITPIPTLDDFYPTISEEAARLHTDCASIPQGLSCRLSIGLIRVAHVQTCMKLAEHLQQDGRFVVCAYHARDLEERRYWREQWLDRVLNRNEAPTEQVPPWVSALKKICPWLIEQTGDVRLIVVATPVEEVGRDHDFDWCVIEPSSMHSIIQTAGRVNRHRRQPLSDETYNVSLLSRNRSDLEHPQRKCFVKPGLESEATHPSHDLHQLMQSTSHPQMSSSRLDSGLVFDEGGRKTLFAVCDENAVRQQIQVALPVIGRDPGFEMSFMTKRFAQQYPLRDADSGQDCYEVDIAHLKFSLMGDKSKNNQSGKVGLHPIPERVWLCLDQDEHHPAPVQTLYLRKSKCFDHLDIHWHGVLAKEV